MILQIFEFLSDLFETRDSDRKEAQGSTLVISPKSVGTVFIKLLGAQKFRFSYIILGFSTQWVVIVMKFVILASIILGTMLPNRLFTLSILSD